MRVTQKLLLFCGVLFYLRGAEGLILFKLLLEQYAARTEFAHAAYFQFFNFGLGNLLMLIYLARRDTKKDKVFVPIPLAWVFLGLSALASFWCVLSSLPP
jgi:hypothetical protein